MLDAHELAELQRSVGRHEVTETHLQIKYALRPHLDALVHTYSPAEIFHGVLDLAIDFAMETMTAHRKPLLWAWFEVKEVFRQRPHARDAGLGDLL